MSTHPPAPNDVATAAAALGPAFAAIDAADAETLADMCAATGIPAPLHGEARRGEWLRGRLERLGLGPVQVDAAGNVLARAGAGAAGAIVLAAHLDTVFEPDADLEVRARGDRLLAPGISDNGRGLAALVRLAAVLPLFPPLRHPLLFAGTVGEEGAGDLRGVKHLFRDPAFRPAAFIAVDGAGLGRVVHRAVGSRRLRVRVSGPGGHSWTDRGLANPVHALAAAVAGLDGLARAAGGAGVAVNVGRIGGGTSVNAIPQEAWLELDLRSESAAAVRELELGARALFQAAVRAPLELAVSVIGDRPCGVLPPDHPLVRAAAEATAWFGEAPELAASSTDANVPLALGVPAIALGAGGRSGGMHTLAEWYENERGPAGIQRLALVLLLADRLLVR